MAAQRKVAAKKAKAKGPTIHRTVVHHGNVTTTTVREKGHATKHITTVKTKGRTVTTTRQGDKETRTVSGRKGDRRVTHTTVSEHGRVVSENTSDRIVAPTVPETAAQKAKRKRGAVGTPLTGKYTGPWVLGYNDRIDTCVPTAVANSFLIQTGHKLAGWEVIELHHAFGHRPITIENAMHVLRGIGIGGYRPVSVEPVAFDLGPKPSLRRFSRIVDVGDLLGVPVGTRPHCVVALSQPGRVVSWGEDVNLMDYTTVEEVWRIKW
jgi:hypothetical protein